MKNKKEYALYKGDNLLGIGTIKELSDKLKVKEKTLHFYHTPCYLNRGKGKKSKNKRILIKL